MIVLAGDVGGTNTRLALFEAGRPAEPLVVERAPSDGHATLDGLVAAFVAAQGVRPEAASFGVAGPVRDGRVDGVNLAWPVVASELAATLGLAEVGLLNDLEANAWGIAALSDDDVRVLQSGDPDGAGNRAVISAGTGLGMAGLYWDGEWHRPFATEGGHADFAPRTEEEIELLSFLLREHGHVSAERVCSGMGLVNCFRSLLATSGVAAPAWFEGADDGAAAISRAGLAGDDELASRALDMLCGIYGAEAGNLALKVMATGGVYVGGGIAPKIVERLAAGGFVAAFRAKGRLTSLMETISVRVILNDRTALYGAGLHAAACARRAVNPS